MSLLDVPVCRNEGATVLKSLSSGLPMCIILDLNGLGNRCVRGTLRGGQTGLSVEVARPVRSVRYDCCDPLAPRARWT